MAGVEALTTTELCRSMRERGIDEETVEILEGGDIDGQTLVLLVEDYTEFSGLVPKPGPRLKIKKYLQQFTPSVPVAAQSSSIKTSSDTCNGQSCGELSDSDSSFSETSPEPSSRKRNRASSADIDESIDLTKVNQPQKKVKAIEEDITEAPTFNKENVQPNTCNLANIPLPTRFSFRVQKAIERGELAEKEIRLAFVRDCVDYFQPLLPNPGREGYSEIAKKLCDTYPCLKDRRTNNYWKTLSSQLSQRYHNSRRSSRKVTDQKLCHQCEVSVDATNTPSLQNSSAERERDEENVQALKKLVQGKAAPTQVVQTLLDATRPQRKVYLERVDISVRDILEVYPVFRIPKWVLYEFCKLLEGEDAKATIMSSWQKTCDKLKSLSSVSSEEESEFERDMLVFKIIERNIYNKKPSIHPVSFIKAGEDLESHFTSEMMEPRLLVFHDDQDIVQMFVVAENEALLELSCVSSVEGFVYLIATYYIFNVSYPNYCKPTLYFLQDVLLARPDANIRRPVRYSSFLSRHGL